MNRENQVTLLDIYEFLKTMERQNSERFDALEKRIESLNRKHKKIMTAFEALFSNNHNDFACIEFQLKMLEAKILKAYGIDIDSASDSDE